MAYPDQLGGGRKRKHSPGHYYERVNVSGDARVHAGNNYHFGLDNPLRDLPYAKDAPFNSFAEQHELACLTGTRVELLGEIYKWADGQDERCIFWLRGLAGTGKSTIARTVARKYSDKKRLAASFFFSRGGDDVSHAAKFVTSLAVQIADNVPASRQHIHAAVEERSKIASQSLRDQWDHLVFNPLSELSDCDCPASLILVVDALDECNNDKNIRTIVELLSKARSLKTVRLRVLLTSRPEVPIRHGFLEGQEGGHQNVALHDIPSPIVDEDITLFLKHKFSYIRQEEYLDSDWPGVKVISSLVRKASGLFIWAATAYRFVLDGKCDAATRLDTILRNDRNATDTPEGHLNKIHTTVLENSIQGYKGQDREKPCRAMRYILGIIVVLFSPLSAQSLGRLLDIENGVQRTLKDLHAILDIPDDIPDIPDDEKRPIRLHHPSFRDFLLSKDRCSDANFWVKENEAHKDLAFKCLQLMSSSLKQDACGFGSPGTLAAKDERAQLKQYLSPELRYACHYWIQHLTQSGVQLSDGDEVHRFLQKYCLHWLEALGRMAKVPEGINAISSLESMTLTRDCPALYAFVHDMKRFALYSRSVIEQDPLQVYCSGLVFAPSGSILKKQFAEDKIPGWIKKLPQVDSSWSAVLQTLEGHTSGVAAVAFSPDSKVLASGSDDDTIKLWDVGTGAVLQTLRGHSGEVTKLAFSLDGNVLASASYDGTVKVWEAGIGTLRHTFYSHASEMAFSLDGKELALLSQHKTISLWNISRGERSILIKCSPNSARAVTFSPDGTALALVAEYKEVRLLNVSNGEFLQVAESYEEGPVAFSSDGKILASVSINKTLTLWDASMGKVLQTLESNSDEITQLAFSPDSKVLVSESNNDLVKLWNTDTGELVQTLVDCSFGTGALAFSPDNKALVFTSDEESKTIKLWKASADAKLYTLKGHSDDISAVAFSPDGKVLASASDDKTIKLWEAGIDMALTHKGDLAEVRAIVFSRDGTVLASISGDMWSRDKTIKLWDVGTGLVLKTLETCSAEVNAVAFSPDGKVLASILWVWESRVKMIKLWDVGTGLVLKTLETCFGEVDAVAFSPDGKLLVSASQDKTIKLWGIEKGTIVYTLKDQSDIVSAVAFSPDGKLLASRSGDGTVKLWGADMGAAGAVLQPRSVDATLSMHLLSGDAASLRTYSEPTSTRFSFTTSSSWQTTSPNVSIEEQWIEWQGSRKVWIPSEYRAFCAAVYGDVVALGHNFGRVSLLATTP